MRAEYTKAPTKEKGLALRKKAGEGKDKQKEYDIRFLRVLAFLTDIQNNIAHFIEEMLEACQKGYSKSSVSGWPNFISDLIEDEVVSIISE